MKKIKMALILLSLIMASPSLTLKPKAWETNVTTIAPVVYEVTTTTINVYSTIVAPKLAPSSVTPIKKYTVTLGTRFVVNGASGTYLRLSNNEIVWSGQFKKSTLTYNDLYIPGTVKRFDIVVYQTNKTSVPAWEHPLATSRKVTTYSNAGTLVQINGNATNKYGSLFLRTNTGAYIFSGNLTRVNYLKPCPGNVTSHFGIRVSPITGLSETHYGTDFGWGNGLRIVASREGVVKETKYNFIDGRGRFIIIDHGNGIETRYYHLSDIYVTVGQKVIQGAEIAKMGNTGSSTATHLHFELRINGVAKNPLNYINSTYLCTTGCR
jgi:murein DD-endopeptidase MepM/ murein hydrolase activator NlpD